MIKIIQTLSIFLLTNLAIAAPIYKSVDQHGHVSYSEKPPVSAAKVETVTPPPPPNEQEVARAKQRYRDLEARDALREQERKELAEQQAKREQQRAYSDLKRKLSKPKPSNVIVINQNPTYGRFYPRWKRRPRAVPPRKGKNGKPMQPPSLKPRSLGPR